MPPPLPLALLALSLPIALGAPLAPSALSPDYRRSFALYAVSDRPDGFVRRLYASPDAVRAARAGQVLPLGAWLVIETHTARRKGGALERDRAGHLIPERLERDLDVKRKVANVPLDFENWDFARLERSSLRPQNVNVADCWICHQSAEKRDFTFSRQALVQYARTGRTVRRDCALPERQLCAHDFDFAAFGVPGRESPLRSSEVPSTKR